MKTFSDWSILLIHKKFWHTIYIYIYIVNNLRWDIVNYIYIYIYIYTVCQKFKWIKSIDFIWGCVVLNLQVVLFPFFICIHMCVYICMCVGEGATSFPGLLHFTLEQSK